MIEPANRVPGACHRRDRHQCEHQPAACRQPQFMAGMAERCARHDAEDQRAHGADAQRVMDGVEGKTRAELEGGVEVDGETYELTDEMVSYEAEPPEHVSAAAFDGGTVYVDTELTDDIEAEGYARDVVRRIQEMRKRLDLAVESEIHTAVDIGDDRVAGFVDRHRDYVASETRSRELTDGQPADGEWELVEEWDVEGVAVTIGVEPVDA